MWEGNTRAFVDEGRGRQAGGLVFLYLLTYVLGVLLLSAHGYSLRDSAFEFASALGTVGLSVGITSAQMPDSALWGQILAMFLGRLEFIVVIVSVLKLGKDVRLMIARPSRNG